MLEMFKALVGTACVCIVALTAHYAYERHSEYAETTAFNAKCGHALTLNKAVIATDGDDEFLKKRAIEAFREAPGCIGAAKTALRAG